MKPEVLSKVGTPFFTTAPRARAWASRSVSAWSGPPAAGPHIESEVGSGHGHDHAADSSPVKPDATVKRSVVTSRMMWRSGASD